MRTNSLRIFTNLGQIWWTSQFTVNVNDFRIDAALVSCLVISAYALLKCNQSITSIAYQYFHWMQSLIWITVCELLTQKSSSFYQFPILIHLLFIIVSFIRDKEGEIALHCIAYNLWNCFYCSIWIFWHQLVDACTKYDLEIIFFSNSKKQ